VKAMQSLLNVIARKKPREVFSTQVGNHTVRAIEQEFVLEPARGKKGDSVQVEYVAGKKNLLNGDRFAHYITVKAASDKYRLAVRTIQQLCRERKIVCRRQGAGDNSPWLVAEESIKAYSEAQGKRR
jgi:hypothetical protein